MNLAKGAPDFAIIAKFGDKIANLATLPIESVTASFLDFHVNHHIRHAPVEPRAFALLHVNVTVIYEL